MARALSPRETIAIVDAVLATLPTDTPARARLHLVAAGLRLSELERLTRADWMQAITDGAILVPSARTASVRRLVLPARGLAALETLEARGAWGRFSVVALQGALRAEAAAAGFADVALTVGDVRHVACYRAAADRRRGGAR